MGEALYYLLAGAVLMGECCYVVLVVFIAVLALVVWRDIRRRGRRNR